MVSSLLSSLTNHGTYLSTVSAASLELGSICHHLDGSSHPPWAGYSREGQGKDPHDHSKDKQGSSGPQRDTWVWRKIGNNE